MTPVPRLCLLRGKVDMCQVKLWDGGDNWFFAEFRSYIDEANMLMRVF